MLRRIVGIALLALIPGCGRLATPDASSGGSGSDPSPAQHAIADALITRTEALTIAWREEGRTDASSVSARLRSVDLTEQGPARLAWVVTYHGVCIRGHGPLIESDREQCAATQYGVAIDAVTGRFLVAGS